MRFILLVVLERTVRFLTIVIDVVLEEYNNYLSTNKWLGVKHVSIVFGQTYVNGALLTISSTSNNSNFYFFKVTAKKIKWLQKIGGGGAHPAPPPESASDYGVNLMHPHLFKKNQ